MPASESIQHTLDRVRPPRVQITYDVEIGDAIESKELPFVMGIMADLSGSPEEPLPRVKDRKFVEIDRDNFNDVLEASNARLDYSVPNKLDGEGNLKVELNFKDMEDFEPLSVVQQIEPLRQLFEARQRLADLLAKLDGNDDLDDLLQQVLENTKDLEEIKSQVDEARATADGEGGGKDEKPAKKAKK
ncbi:TPA: type VI secretion system contractile sheath small subunit [Candidatus Latescibacteria bacterium]|nr:type VI secretion system contractile sheath small subunit [Candidatus Latescibacterota bacterium]